MITPRRCKSRPTTAPTIQLAIRCDLGGAVEVEEVACGR